MKQWQRRKQGFAAMALVAVLLLGCCTTAWAKPTAGEAVSSNILVRASAVDGDRIGSLSAGQAVSILDETTGSDGNVWYEVSYEKSGSTVTGWVRSDLLTVTAEEEEEEVLEEAEETLEDSETTGLPLYSRFVPYGDGTIDVTDPPDAQAAAMLETGRFVQTFYEFEEGEVIAYVLASPYDELINDDEVDLTNYYIVYGYDENLNASWYIFDAENGTLQVSLFDVQYTTGIEVDVDPMVSMTICALGVICLLLLLLTIIFSVRCRRLKEALEDEEEEEEEEVKKAPAPKKKEEPKAAVPEKKISTEEEDLELTKILRSEPLFYDDDDDELEFL